MKTTYEAIDEEIRRAALKVGVLVPDLDGMLDLYKTYVSGCLDDDFMGPEEFFTFMTTSETKPPDAHIRWEGDHGTETILSTLGEAQDHVRTQGGRTVIIAVVDERDEVECFFAGPRLETLGLVPLLQRYIMDSMSEDDDDAPEGS